MSADRILERQRRNHRRVPQGLQFQVAAALGPLKFDNDQRAVRVESQQIDTALAVLLVGKLFRDQEGARRDQLDLIAQEPLQIAAFTDARLCKSSFSQWYDRVLAEFVNSHGHSLAGCLASSGRIVPEYYAVGAQPGAAPRSQPREILRNDSPAR